MLLPEYEEYESTKLVELTKTAVIYTDESYETLSDDTTTITLVELFLKKQKFEHTRQRLNQMSVK